MLLDLKIINLAIVDRLHLTFHSGLNVMTGETGAGKSIILGSLALLFGDRVPKDCIRDGAEEAVVDGRLSTRAGDALDRHLDELSLPKETDGCVRLCRLVNRAGRSRATINGKSATLPMLQEIGALVADIHGQNENQGLLRPDVQRGVLDAFSKAEEQRSAYCQAFRQGKDLDAALKKLLSQNEDRNRSADLLEFQSRELSEAHLRIGEDRELLERRGVLSQTERLGVLAGEARAILAESDPSAMDLLGQVETRLRGLADADPERSSLAESFRTQVACLKDAAGELRRYIEKLQSKPEELARVEERLFFLESLKRKYGGSIESALAILEELETRRDDLEHFDERLADLEARRDPTWEKVEQLGRILSEARAEGATELEKRVAKEFSELKLQKSRLEIETVPRAGRPEESWTDAGADDIRFLISTNPGERPKPIERVVSGGEISRIMLALRTVLADIDRTPILVFDEIDAGIGGAVAEAVGQRLKRLAKGRQVICVTHLPQIASQADVHTVIAKGVREGRSTVRANRVEGPRREEEIARMLGGIRITETTRRHAREMLNGV